MVYIWLNALQLVITVLNNSHEMSFFALQSTNPQPSGETQVNVYMLCITVALSFITYLQEGSTSGLFGNTTLSSTIH